MDYVRGKTLREKIRALEGIRLNWFLTIVRALQKMNKSGELAYHGDLKPENIVVKPSGSVMLVDPGMRAHDRGVITTTPYYNPLLLRDSKADVMGIGVMLYEILTGVLPFDEAPWNYAGREQGGEVERLSLSYFLSYPPPKDLNPNTPEPLARMIYRCLTVTDYGLPDLEKDLVDFLRKE
jgi:serine/threonine protein kinase